MFIHNAKFFLLVMTVVIVSGLVGCTTSTGEIPDLKTAQRAHAVGDIERAKVHYQALAKKGYEEGTIGLAKLSLSGERPLKREERQAIEAELKELSANSAAALETLAEIALTERPPQKNKALSYYKEALLIADKDNAKIALKLGDLYSNMGKGTEAIKWYKTAYMSGEGKAVYRIGRLYEKGMGVTKNLAKSLSYYLIAKQDGLESADMAIERIAMKLSPSTRAKAEENTILLKSNLSISE